MDVTSMSHNQHSGTSPSSLPGRGRLSVRPVYQGNQLCSHLAHRAALSMQQVMVPALSAYLILLPVLYNIFSRRRVRFMGLGWVLSAPATTCTINSGSQALPHLSLSNQMDNHQGISLLQVGHSIL